MTAKTEIVPIPDHGITDAEMWANVDTYQAHKRILTMLKEVAPSVFLTNRARLAIANAFADFAIEHEKRVREGIADELRRLRHENPCQGDCEICQYANGLQKIPNSEDQALEDVCSHCGRRICVGCPS